MSYIFIIFFLSFSFRDTVNETVNAAVRLRVRNVHKDLSEVVLEGAYVV